MTDPTGSSIPNADLDWSSNIAPEAAAAESADVAWAEAFRFLQSSPENVKHVNPQLLENALTEALEALTRDGSQEVGGLTAASEVYRALGDLSQSVAVLASAPSDWLVSWQRARCSPDASDEEWLALVREQASCAPSDALALELHLRAFELARSIGQSGESDLAEGLAKDGAHPIFQELGIALGVVPARAQEAPGLPAAVANFAHIAEAVTAEDWLAVVNALAELSLHVGAGASLLRNAIGRAAGFGSRPVESREPSSGWDRLLGAIDERNTEALAACADIFRATDSDLSGAAALLSGKQLDLFDDPFRAANYAVWKSGSPSSSQAIAAEFVDDALPIGNPPFPLDVERALRRGDQRGACRALSEWSHSLVGEDPSFGVVEATQLARLGHTGPARTALERIAETSPDHVAVLEALRRLVSKDDYVHFLQAASEASSKATASHFQIEAAGFADPIDWLPLLQNAHLSLPFVTGIARFVSSGSEGWSERWAAATGETSEHDWAESLARLEGSDVARGFGLPETRGAAAREHERLAGVVTGTESDKLLLAAACGYLDAGLTDEALRALGAASAKTSPFWLILHETAEAQLSVVATATDELLEALQLSSTADDRVEMRERLAWLDELVRGDSASAVFNHQAIIEEDPLNRASLRRIARSETDLAAWFNAITGLAMLIDPQCPEASAHAELSVHPWASREPLGDGLLRRLASMPTIRVVSARALALGAIDQHQLDDAERWVTVLLARIPHARGLYAETLALLAFLHDDFDRCVRWAQEALSAQPERVLSRLLLPLSLEAKGDAVNALDYMAALIAALPSESPPALKQSLLARAVKLGDLANRDVLQWLAPLCVADPSDVARFHRAANLARANQELPAHSHILRARLQLAIGEERTSIEVELAELLLKAGDPKGAVLLIESALQAQPDAPKALEVAALVFRAAQESAREEATLLQLVRRATGDNDQVAIFLRLATLYTHHVVNLARAEAAVKEVLRRCPDEGAALELLVTIYRRQRDGAHAVQAQERRIALATMGEDVRQRTIELAEIYESVCLQPAKAEAVFERLRDASPLHVPIIERLASLLERTGQAQAREFSLDRSVVEARRALERGADPVACLLAIDKCYELGKKDRAVTRGLLAAFAGHTASVQPAIALLAELELYRPKELAPAVVAYFARMGKALDEVAGGDLAGADFTALDAHSSLAAQAARMLKLSIRVTPTSSRTQVAAHGYALALEVHPGMHEVSPGARTFLVTVALCHLALGTAFMTRLDGPEAATLIEASILRVSPSAFFDDVPERAQAARRFSFDRNDPELPLLALEALGTFRHDWSRLTLLFNLWASTAAWVAMGYDSAAVVEACAWRAGLSREEVVKTQDFREWLLHALQVRH